MNRSTNDGNRHWAQWLDSMEGVPEYAAPAHAHRDEIPDASGRAYAAFERLGGLLPGIGLAFLLAFAGSLLADALGVQLLGYAQSPISAVTIAILLGLLIRNALGLPSLYEAGLRVCLRHVLRFGIVLLGLRLSLQELGGLATMVLPIVVACVVGAILIVTWISRWIGLPRRLGSLIAVGTSICGVSAIAATAPIIDAEEDEVSYAIACITLFGLLALLLYPFAARALYPDDPRSAGVFLGTAIHDTAQVAGAGVTAENLYRGSEQPEAAQVLKAATVTKLVRNTCMAAVIPLMAYWYHRSLRQDRPKRKAAWHQAVPLFVLFFVLMALVRSVGDWSVQQTGIPRADLWKALLHAADRLSGWCLAMAMAAVGLGTSLSKLKTLGLKPFTAGLAAALIVGGLSLGLLALLAALGIS